MISNYKRKNRKGYKLFLGSMACGLKNGSKLLGFKTQEAFIAWLRTNEFMDKHHMPSGHLIRNRCMNYSLVTTYHKTKYDACGFATDGDEYMDGMPVNYRNIPLITKRGVALIKDLLKNKKKLQNLAAEIEFDNLKKLKYANF